MLRQQAAGYEQAPGHRGDRRQDPLVPNVRAQLLD